jgi:hypothetical protein
MVTAHDQILGMINIDADQLYQIDRDSDQGGLFWARQFNESVPVVRLGISH